MYKNERHTHWIMPTTNINTAYTIRKPQTRINVGFFYDSTNASAVCGDQCSARRRCVLSPHEPLTLN